MFRTKKLRFLCLLTVIQILRSLIFNPWLSFLHFTGHGHVWIWTRASNLNIWCFYFYIFVCDACIYVINIWRYLCVCAQVAIHMHMKTWNCHQESSFTAPHFIYWGKVSTWNGNLQIPPSLISQFVQWNPLPPSSGIASGCHTYLPFS